MVTPDVLRPLSNDSVAVEQISSLLPPTSEGAQAVLLSPQFQQALGVFGSALQSGQLGHLMSEFGLGQSVVDAANTGSEEHTALVYGSHFVCVFTVLCMFLCYLCVCVCV